MSCVSIVGLQWGDEGKGKIVDYLAEHSDVVVRFQGGHNAGHTIVANGKTYKLSILPSNVIRDGGISIIGNGTVIDPFHLIKEIGLLREAGANISSDNLIIAENACLILPIHQAIDEVNENMRSKTKIGTTKRGIGPAYSDKIARRAIRVCDLDDKELLSKKIDEMISFYAPLLNAHSDIKLSKTEMLNNLLNIAEEIIPFVQPAWKILNEFIANGKKVMFEGAQGVMLDIDHGTYPYVTSSNTITGQISAGSGASGNHVKHNIGVVKAYTTRVGSGPFPSELFNETGELLQKKGHEFGTVTGRNRRCGWIDVVQLKQMIKICNINSIALTKLDVLSNFDEIKICTAYEYNGVTYDYFPASQKIQANLTPIYETVPGWNEDISGKTLVEMPDTAKSYIKRLEELLGTPIDIVSTSPKREDTLIEKEYFQAA